MQRIAVVGCPGAGKTTLAARLAGVLGLPHIEIDSLNWQPGWTEAAPDDFQAALADSLDAAVDGWITCGNYESRSGGLHIDRSDTIIWLDPPRRTIMARVVWRTIRRAVRREELWNGNREPLSNFTRWNPEHNVIRWAWVHFPIYRTRYAAARHDGSWVHAEVHHLRSSADVASFWADATRPT